MKTPRNFSIFIFIISLSLNAQTLKTLPLNEITVGGWIKNQIERDITSGYMSIYSDLQPTMQGNVYGPNKVKNFSIDKDGNWEARRESWWAGEHEGYYADIVVRSAFLTGYKPWLGKAKTILDYVVKNQESTGYIGIYDKECRLDNLLNENGELWSQSRIFGALLAYYEYSGDKKYLEAVQKAVDYTMSRYGTNGKSYFHQPKPNGGGLTHGLMFIETLEWLYKLTNDKKYIKSAEWLYADYCSAEPKLGNTDNQLKNLLDRETMYKDHGVHVCEHLRVPLFLASVSPEPLLKQASENAIYKISRSINPSGAIATDKKKHESVAYNYGSPDLPFEYCTITELLISFSSAMQKRGEARFGDMIENLTYNAAQGARLPDGKAIAYLSMDNQSKGTFKDNFRYQYAACHKVACCNLNAAKIMPYFASNMWMKSSNNKAIYAQLFGTSEVNTELNGSKVKITETTNYPFENTVRFVISPSKNSNFDFVVRNPVWSANTKIKAEGAIVKNEKGYLRLSKNWKAGDVVEVTFEAKIEAHKTLSNDFYFTNGPLIYSMPIEETRTATQEFANGLKNYDILPKDSEQAVLINTQYNVEPNVDINLKEGKTNFSFVSNSEINFNYPFDAPASFIEGEFYINKKPIKVKLQPYGTTLLRRTSFPSYK